MPTLQEQLKALLAKPLQDADLQQQPLQAVLQNVQGNILHSHGRDFAAHIFLEFQAGKEAQVQQWLRDSIVSPAHFGQYQIIRSAQDQLVERKTKRRDGLFVGCLLSAQGYSFLGRPLSDEQGSVEFRGGMK